jgi:hypothetical protein
MIRKTLIALVGVAALGSATAALAEYDGDGNKVPGVSYDIRQAPVLERSFAGPAPVGVSAQERAIADRLSQVH